MSKPNPECKKCNGTGYIEGKSCDCWRLINGTRIDNITTDEVGNRIRVRTELGEP